MAAQIAEKDLLLSLCGPRIAGPGHFWASFSRLKTGRHKSVHVSIAKQFGAWFVQNASDSPHSVNIPFWNNYSVPSQLLPPVPNIRTRGQKSTFLGQFCWHLAGCHLVLDSSCHLSVLARRFKIASVTFFSVSMGFTGRWQEVVLGEPANPFLCLNTCI